MREIEFRGKHKYNGKWAYGSLLISERQDSPAYRGDESKKFGPLGPDKLYWHEYHIFPCDKENCSEIHPETVGQYTGLKDKNGVKIFEGDIAKLSVRPGLCLRGAVTWSRMHLQWIVNDPLCEFVNAIEVVGNIHDNPELLGGDKSLCADCRAGVAKGAECYMAVGVCENEKCETPLCGECAGSWEFDCSKVIEALT